MINESKFPVSLHDASFVKMNFIVDEKRVVNHIELTFVDESNRYIEVIFNDVFAFEFSDILYQNVVLDAELYLGADKIAQYFREAGNNSINLKGLELAKHEMTVISSSIGFNGFVIYKNKSTKGPN